MKTDNELPILSDTRWLYAGQNVMYGNTPAINTNNIISITYYQDKTKSTIDSSRGENYNNWYILFGDNVKWWYDNKEIMLEDYEHICKLIGGFKPDDERTYI
jgi:hypothetical protein